MSEVSSVEIKWIENHLIPGLSKNLGKSSNNVYWEISFPQNAFFLSHVYFLTVTFDSRINTNEKASGDTLKLVVKRPPKASINLVEWNMDKQFHNEILFYTKVAKESSRFPRCFYTAEGALDETVIVIENITPLGYEICAQAFDVPLEYVLSAAEEIGRFHAMGYVMKEQKPEEFNRIVNDIQEARFLEVSWMRTLLDAAATRPIEWLRKNNCEPTFCDKLEKHFSNAFTEIMMESVKPVEPLATLCHGDFTRNNIFFRKIDGKMEAMLFDFAALIYASPAIDLSTFLYLNCSTSDRIAKFNNIFGAYHKALITYLQDSGIMNLERYSYDKILADYKRRATFGFMIALFFLPVTRGFYVRDSGGDVQARARGVKAAGGEAMTEEFGKMVLELRDTGCFDHLCY